MDELTPKEIVSYLDKYIIGQNDAKKSVAIAMRNRWRRRQVAEELREEIYPKNIIMIGPTGVGKTEIARRLSKLTKAPFLKVEATKFTEVGYVGKDVDSMIRDLTRIGVDMVKAEEKEKVKEKAAELAEERLLDLLIPSRPKRPRTAPMFKGLPIAPAVPTEEQPEIPNGNPEEDNETREKMRIMLREGKLDDKTIELERGEKVMPAIEIFSAQGMEEMDLNIREAFGNIFPKKSKRRKIKVSEAKKMIAEEEASQLIDMDKVTKEAIKRVEQTGIIFLDEIDKVASKGSAHGPDVSREGVQRDLLPIVEGTTVNTKFGMVKTDHILFIASGAFHISKPSDLIPELQGRFPIRVELKALTKDDFVRILTEPQNSLTRQYIEMLKTEGLSIKFNKSAISEISKIAYLVNSRMENIGARRLHTVMERLFEDVSFNAPDMKEKEIAVDDKYVTEKLQELVKNEDLSRFIL